MSTNNVPVDRNSLEKAYSNNELSAENSELIEEFQTENARKQLQNDNASIATSSYKRDQNEFMDNNDLVKTESRPGSNKTLSRILTGEDLDEKLNPQSDPYKDLPQMGGDRDYPPVLFEDRTPYEVTFSDEDAVNFPQFEHPYKWSFKKKLMTVVILCLNCLGVTMGSSNFASCVPQIMAEYGVIEVVGILGITLYVFGFALGPVVYGPLSELYGRRNLLIISSFGFTLFQFAVATGENLQTILICRFFAGCVGAAPLAVIPAAMSDMFDNYSRGKVVSIFSLTVFLGPILTPVYSSYIVQHTTWRWVQYVSGIYAGLCTLAICFLYDESHHPIVLCKKAQYMREKSGNWGIYAAHELLCLDIKDIFTKTIARPLKMLRKEPILLLMTVYNTFVYGILYLMLEAYPYIFEIKKHFYKNGELPYIGLIVGMSFFSAMMIFILEPRYIAAVAKNNGKPCPEERLIGMMVSGPVFTIGIFWLMWTGNYNSVPWIVPTIGGAFIGFGLIGIFLTSFNYLIDAYLLLAASAIAGNTFLRSGFGASFPLFAGYMLKGMGVNWAGLLLGLFSAALIPVPFLFYKYGKWLRQKSSYAFDL
ncbi:hypothetical protein ACO0OL_000700 [Hanseniaspora opuntiae]